jgi:hypothetical protein
MEQNETEVAVYGRLGGGAVGGSWLGMSNCGG